ncbi:hypothetical protein N302_01143, partial [Corvus brachyrhynchos]
QAVGNQGVIYITIPFLLVEVQQWKALVGQYRDNPEKVANLVRRAIKIYNPDWKDLNVVLDTLLDETEKEMVNKAVISTIEILITAGSLQGSVNDIFPLNDPGWDPNVAEQRAKLKRYQDWIVFGLKHTIPKAVNWSKLYEVRQDRKENPTDFLN